MTTGTLALLMHALLVEHCDANAPPHCVRRNAFMQASTRPAEPYNNCTHMTLERKNWMADGAVMIAHLLNQRRRALLANLDKEMHNDAKGRLERQLGSHRNASSFGSSFRSAGQPSLVKFQVFLRTYLTQDARGMVEHAHVSASW